jgi:cobalt/nickel transport system permease protein
VVLAALLFYGVVLAALRREGIPSTSAEHLALTSLVAAHLPLAGVEGLFTRWVVLFLQRVQPQLLGEDEKL